MEIVSMDHGSTNLSLDAADCKFLAEVLEEGVKECGLGQTWKEERYMLLDFTMTLFRALAVSSIVGMYLGAGDLQELVKEGYITKGRIMDLEKKAKKMKRKSKQTVCEVTDIERGVSTMLKKSNGKINTADS